MPSTENKWTKIDDSKVSIHWKCPECGETCEVESGFFQDNGTPVCDCHCDMVYSHTEICQ